MNEASQMPIILNKHFASVGTRLASKLPPPPKHHLDYVRKCISPLSSFLFEQVFPGEIRSDILSIANDKSYGLYSSPTKLLKLSSSIIAPVLSELLNISIKTGSSKLTIAKITPIFKSDDESDANNYRHISLLSNFNRIFEKIMRKRITSYIEQHDLLYKLLLLGHRRLIKKITQTAVINIVFQRIFFKELDVSYASQHTFSKVTVTIFENYIIKQ